MRDAQRIALCRQIDARSAGRRDRGSDVALADRGDYLHVEDSERDSACGVHESVVQSLAGGSPSKALGLAPRPVSAFYWLLRHGPCQLNRSRASCCSVDAFVS